MFGPYPFSMETLLFVDFFPYLLIEVFSLNISHIRLQILALVSSHCLNPTYVVSQVFVSRYVVRLVRRVILLWVWWCCS